MDDEMLSNANEAAHDEYASPAKRDYTDYDAAHAMPEAHWQSPEYIFTPKTSDWYWALWIIAAALGVTFVIIGNVLLALVVLIGVFALSLQAGRHPHMLDCSIDNRGVRVGKRFHPHKDVVAYDFEEYDGIAVKLLVKTKTGFPPLLSVIVLGADTDEIRRAAAAHIPHEEIQEPLMYKIFDYLGF